MTSLSSMGVAGLSRALAAGEVSSVEVTTELLAAIDRHAGLGAFRATDAERAPLSLGGLLRAHPGLLLASALLVVAVAITTRWALMAAGTRYASDFPTPVPASMIACSRREKAWATAATIWR